MRSLLHKAHLRSVLLSGKHGAVQSAYRERPAWAGLAIDKVDHMTRLFTMIELECLTMTQLEELREMLLRILILTEYCSPERRNILASMENIDRVWNRRFAARAQFP